MDYYWFFSRKLVWFGMIWVPVPKIDVWGIFPTQFLSQNTNFKSELKNVNKHGILKFTLLLTKLEHKVFQNSMVLTKSQNWPQIPTQWWKLSGKNASYVNFWNWHSNHSKSDEFARKKSIIIHDLNWCQKLPGIILVTSTNFILKNILVKVPFWAKTMVPYESQKREKIHISYIVHPRKISLTESRGSRSFLY